MFDPNSSPLAGMSTADLQAALAAAQQAYRDLMLGAKGVSFSYTQGDGARSVAYQQTNPQQVLAFINLVKAQLGMPSGRRPVRFNFR